MEDFEKTYDNAVLHIEKLKGILAVAEASCLSAVNVSLLDMYSCIASCFDIAEMLMIEINTLSKVVYVRKV